MKFKDYLIDESIDSKYKNGYWYLTINKKPIGKVVKISDGDRYEYHFEPEDKKSSIKDIWRYSVTDLIKEIENYYKKSKK